MSSIFLSVSIQTAMTYHCEPGWSWVSRPETFHHFNLWVVLSGRGEMTAGGKAHELSAGTVCCFRPRTTCQATHDPKNRLVVTAIHFHFLDLRARRWRPADELLPPVIKRIADLPLFERLCRRIVRLDDLPGGREEAETYLSAMLIGLRAERLQPLAESSPLAVAEQLIRQQPGEVGSITELARQSGMSAEHFSRAFRRAFGKSPHELLIEARLGRARQLLSHNQLQVQQVAALLGYRDLYFFSRQFRQHTGMTPSAWRAAGGDRGDRADAGEEGRSTAGSRRGGRGR